MTGWLAVAGLGPGDPALVTREVTQALAQATDVLGYIPYVARIPARAGLVLHPSDNREELDRARHALHLAAEGRRVVVVSSGDPGVFAMAAAVFEAVEDWPDAPPPIRVLPGITAMLAAAARAGEGRAANITIPARADQAVRVRIDRPDGAQRTVFVDPHTATVTGVTAYGGVTETIKKLHSLSLFGGPVGTALNILVEIVAGWAIILCATGIYLWWPRRRQHRAARVFRFRRYLLAHR